eukprot:NODE_4622_length_313_cov_5.291667_g4540_i0.p1 GENE.NODE_4622_length_313_cov_5.291667_g4540_i0~~NODE_4622_length_313_cov_5.291667_g4540_i0.p1  ORF type:complete len:60 (+),score=3.78 NODE_4622_length_313_cov_5.291667_g4540_i0:89-268(+)
MSGNTLAFSCCLGWRIKWLCPYMYSSRCALTMFGVVCQTSWRCPFVGVHFNECTQLCVC